METLRVKGVPEGIMESGVRVREEDDFLLEIDALPDSVIEALRARSLVLPAPADAVTTHPLYAGRITDDERTVIALGNNHALIDQIKGILSRDGILLETASTAAAKPAGVLLLPLSLPDTVLREWSLIAQQRHLPTVTYLSTPTRILWAVLDPPGTACPLCLALRLRSNHIWQSIADLPLDVLLGAADMEEWPTTAVAAGLLAHQTLSILSQGPASGTGYLMEIDYGSFTSASHSVLHTPNCTGCSAVAILPARAEHDSAEDSHSSWERMRRAVDPLTGIVAGVNVTDGASMPGGMSGISYAVTTGESATHWFSAVRAAARGGAAKSDPTSAQVCALGEALERYGGAVYQPDKLVRSSYRALSATAVDPRTLPLGSPKEYAEVTRYKPFDPDIEIEWVEGRSLSTGEVRHIPACAVYVPYEFPEGQHAWFLPTSNGLAAGANYHHAVQGGLMEVIERDASVIFWENRLVLPTLDLAGIEAAAALDEALAKLTAQGAEVSCKDLTTDLGVPVAAVRIIERDAQHPLVMHTARADLDLSEAICGALAEAFLLRCLLTANLEKGIPEEGQLLKSSIEFALYYCDSDRVRLLDFWDDGPLHRAPSSCVEKPETRAVVEQVVQRLGDRGYEAIAVDLTPIDVAECGVRVVRTIVPGLCPITLRSDFRRRGGSRRYEAPVRMGARQYPLREDELNPYPIPLP
ncbi:YcaO-like family protein [Streptomyces sp. NPDC127084]|uniref:YcaO-like family protein n=1 Tax=Streptomyces sp. NPDC127084 TaxID=3347133 RepID=UPI00366618CA